jgi:hypothetical protein
VRSKVGEVAPSNAILIADEAGLTGWLRAQGRTTALRIGRVGPRG